MEFNRWGAQHAVIYARGKVFFGTLKHTKQSAANCAAGRACATIMVQGRGGLPQPKVHPWQAFRTTRSDQRLGHAASPTRPTRRPEVQLPVKGFIWSLDLLKYLIKGFIDQSVPNSPELGPASAARPTRCAPFFNLARNTGRTGSSTNKQNTGSTGIPGQVEKLSLIHI